MAKAIVSLSPNLDLERALQIKAAQPRSLYIAAGPNHHDKGVVISRNGYNQSITKLSWPKAQLNGAILGQAQAA